MDWQEKFDLAVSVMNILREVKGHPVIIVLFTGPDCPYCVPVKQVVETVSKARAIPILSVDVGTPDGADAASQCMVSSVPYVAVFKEGVLAAQYIGQVLEARLVEALEA